MTALGSQVDRPAVKPSLQKTLTLRGGLTLEQTSLIGALYNGGFGVTLMANPDLFFGPSGFLPYFSTALGPVAQTFFGKAFGAMLTGIAAMHFLDGPSQSLCKQMAITAALILYPMVLCVMDTAANRCAPRHPLHHRQGGRLLLRTHHRHTGTGPMRFLCEVRPKEVGTRLGLQSALRRRFRACEQLSAPFGALHMRKRWAASHGST